MTAEEMAPGIDRAREELADAKEALDAAEKLLPEPGAEKTMASPSLLALLQRVRAAQVHLGDLERLLAEQVALSGSG